MKNTNAEFVLGLVNRTLGYIDERLTGHGERVSYLCMKMLETGGKTDILDPEKILLLAMLHDVGAFKTEDIDKMVEFETKDVTRHAVYGYLFLKNRSFFGKSAEAVLYHHTNYKELSEMSAEIACAATLIHVCDRADILIANGYKGIIDELERKSGTVFDPDIVKQCAECERRFSVKERIESGAWKAEYAEMQKAVKLTETQAAELIRMLVYAIDFRSEQTVTHTAGVVAYADILGKLFGLDEDRLESLKFAAFVHDVGKIATPVSILEKPGRLTDEEMAVMRRHVEYSEVILRDAVPDRITDIAVSHHEKPNGRGYPHGVGGESLDLEQRILAVADVLSALTGRRSYKEPFSKERTVGMISDMRDAGDLSEDVCAMLFENYDDIIEREQKAIAPAEELYRNMKSEYIELAGADV